MSTEYAYILNSFLPEIVLVAVALLVLAADLLLPRRALRHGLTVLAAAGCLLAAGLAGRQWRGATADPRSAYPPAFVQRQVMAMARQGADALIGRAISTHPESPPLFFAGNAVADDLLHALSEPAWTLSGLTQRQARLLINADREGRWWASQLRHDVTESPAPGTPEAEAPLHMMSAGQARGIATAYRAARQDFPDLPSMEIGLGHPGFSVWWFFADDLYATAFKLIIALAACLTLLLSVRFQVDRYPAEFAGLLLFAAVGLMLMVSSLDLVLIFLGLELAAVCLYALAAWRKGDARSAEAGAKYLLLGSLASAFFIYGASLLFVKFGSTHLSVLADKLQAVPGIQTRPEPLVVVAVLMLLVGFAFKVTGAPFHLWAPDVFQGAPTAVAAFLSTASKAAGFAVLLRVLQFGFPALRPQWVLLVGVLAALSMLVGNLVALHQNNVKRLLAYSGIGQAGYVLLAVMAAGLAPLHGSPEQHWGITAAVLYLFLYAFVNIGAFSITGIVARETGSEEMTAFAGLRARSPLLAFSMALLLLSLGGMPLLSGFVGKWFLFLSGAREGQYLLVLLGAATSVISLYYYLLVVKQMYIKPADEGARPIYIGALAGAGLLAIVLITVAIGIYPKPFLEAARMTATSLTTLTGW